jgi:serine/threonine protein phosphatase PrpC
MAELTQQAIWRAFGTTTRGAAHERSGLPNQDHINWYPKRPGRYGPPLVVAVADGHGSAKSFRSDIGSELATQRTKLAVRQILKSEFPDLELSKVKRLLEERLPRDLVQGWQAAVDQHLADNPIKDEEYTSLEAKEGPAGRQKVEANPYLVYGATLLVTLVTESFAAYFQLGDGDILVVSDQGEASRPLPRDERLIANETTSLCSHLAWQDFRSGFQPFAVSPPAMILMSTDGYSNSFRDEESFFKVGTDLLDMLRADGAKKVCSSLRGWLQEASRSGSGDDITLGVIYREDALSPGGPQITPPNPDPLAADACLEDVADDEESSGDNTIL